MKVYKLLFYVLIFVSVFLIYRVALENKINYVAIGDGLSSGINSFGEKSYGYSQYTRDYLNSNKLLRDYNNDYSKKDYRINDMINDINNNISMTNNYKTFKSILRESDLVSISIGMNDYKDLLIFGNKYSKKNAIMQLINSYEKLIKIVKKYAKNNIFVIGLYNIPGNIDNIDEIKYINNSIKKICQNNNIIYIDINDYLNNEKYFSNPNSFYPNILGSKQIFLQIKKYLLQNLNNFDKIS